MTQLIDTYNARQWFTGVSPIATVVLGTPRYLN